MEGRIFEGGIFVKIIWSTSNYGEYMVHSLWDIWPTPSNVFFCYCDMNFYMYDEPDLERCTDTT